VTYQLGVDLGTTYSAAAIGRGGRSEIVSLGTVAPVMPSVVLLRQDGEVIVGEPAMRRGVTEPTRVAREFKRRLGDPTPLVLGGTPYGAEALMAHLLRGIVGTVSQHEGAQPDRVVLTHPANYGPYKVEQMREVARAAGLDLATTLFLTEPQAAAISYAERNRVEPGEVVAVYDFGGGTLDIALVQRNDAGFQIVGQPDGMERFGGIDIDAAIVAFVDQQLDGAVSALDHDDDVAMAAVGRLRDDCRDAKEALSSDTDTAIPVALPGLQTNVRLTRAELESIVRPRLLETVETLDRAVRSAGLTFDRLSRVLLVGGSSRMPVVGETIRQRTGRPISVDAHPKFAIAMGAALYTPVQRTPTAPPPVVRAPTAPPAAPPVPAASGTGPITGPITSQVPFTAPPAQPVAARRTGVFVALGVLAALAVGAVGFAVFRGNGDARTADPTVAPTDEPVTDPTSEPATDPTTTAVADPTTTVADTAAPTITAAPVESTTPTTVAPEATATPPTEAADDTAGATVVSANGFNSLVFPYPSFFEVPVLGPDEGVRGSGCRSAEMSDGLWSGFITDIGAASLTVDRVCVLIDTPDGQEVSIPGFAIENNSTATREIPASPLIGIYQADVDDVTGGCNVFSESPLGLAEGRAEQFPAWINIEGGEVTWVLQGCIGG
jgi:actin-like ATPase involved in cell morphogenesis